MGEKQKVRTTLLVSFPVSHSRLFLSIYQGFFFFLLTTPCLFPSFFALRQETDTNPQMTNTQLKQGSLELCAIIWEETKRKSRGFVEYRAGGKPKRERRGKIRQTEEGRTNSTPTGVVNEHEKYMKGLFPRSDG